VRSHGRVRFPGLRRRLIMTNHHVGVDQLLKLSTPQRDLMRDGFHARTRDEELKCPDLEVQVLWSTEDVTERVNASVGRELSPAAAYEARRKAMSRIEQESKESTASTVRSLPSGTEPATTCTATQVHGRAAGVRPREIDRFFGGDTDNFEFPRFDLDCCFFRVYETAGRSSPSITCDGAARARLTANSLRAWPPRRTRRLLTVDHLKFLRDVGMPTTLRRLWRREVQLPVSVTAELKTNARGRTIFFSSRTHARPVPAHTRRYWTRTSCAEESSPNPGCGGAPPPNPGAHRRGRADLPEFLPAPLCLVRRPHVWSSSLTSRKRWCSSPMNCPNLRPTVFVSTETPSWTRSISSCIRPAPIYDALEMDGMSSGLSLLAELFGGDDPTLVKALGNEPPGSRARRLVQGCTLQGRRNAEEDRAEAGRRSTPPLIQ